MKVLVIGAQHLFGTTKANGTPFDISKIIVAEPNKDAVFKTSQARVCGFYNAELNCTADLVEKLKADSTIVYPCEMELKTSAEIVFGKAQLVVIDYKVLSK